MAEARRPSPPPVLSHCVPLGGFDALLISWTLGNRQEAVEAARRKGLGPEQARYLDELLVRLEAAGAGWRADADRISELGSPVAEMGSDEPSSLSTSETLTTREVAAMLDRTPRQVLNLTGPLGGTKHGNQWLFPRTTVLAYLEDRSAA
jgi:hypothetical protein